MACPRGVCRSPQPHLWPCILLLIQQTWIPPAGFPINIQSHLASEKLWLLPLLGCCPHTGGSQSYFRYQCKCYFVQVLPHHNIQNGACRCRFLVYKLTYKLHGNWSISKVLKCAWVTLSRSSVNFSWVTKYMKLMKSTQDWRPCFSVPGGGWIAQERVIIGGWEE